MILTRLNRVAICALVSATAYGQLHLIAGAPTSNGARTYALTLYRVDQDGAMQSVAELVPRDVGTDWLVVSADHRKAVVFAARTGIVLDLDKAAVAKRCTATHPAGSSVSAPFLADVPGQGLTLEWSELPWPPGRGERRGMILDPGLSCEKSVISVQPREDRFIVASGMLAIAGIWSGTGTGALIERDGALNVADASGRPWTPWGQKIPIDLLAGIDKYPMPVGVVINDLRMMVVAAGKRPRRHLALRKRDQTWHVIDAQTGEWDRLRAFGKFVAIIETRPKKAKMIWGDETKLEDVKRAVAEEAMSPGVEEWRTIMGKSESEQRAQGCRKSDCESRFGPDVGWGFQMSPDYFPGRLLLYNIETEKMFTIQTNQGDSEIVLVEGDTVYYRVNDRLYSAPISETGVGMPRQIAKDEIIRDVHYAFLSR